MPRLRITLTASAGVLVVAVTLVAWVTARPRWHDHAVEVAVAARQARSGQRMHHRVAAAARPKPQPATVIARAPPAPPSPPPVISAPSPRYPVSALRAGRGGVVDVRVTVAASGSVRAVHLAHSSGLPQLDDAALAAVRTWRFGEPSTHAAMTFTLPLTFRIAGSGAH